MPAIHDHQGSGRAPVNSQGGQDAARLAHSLGIAEKVVVRPVAVTAEPAGICIPLGIVNEMIPAGIGIDQYLAAIFHVLVAEQRTARDIEEQIGTRDDLCETGGADAVCGSIDGPEMPAITQCW